MPKITITPEDLKSIISMDAGWKPVTLKAVAHKPSSKKDSMNYEFTWEVDNGNGDVRQIQTWVNDKNRKMFVEGLLKHYEALMDTHVPDDAALEVEPEQWIGLSCWGEVTKEIVNNRPVNNLVNFSPKSQPPF